MLGDDRSLAILARGGRFLQLVELDIPRIAKEFRPTEFHVTSQASAVVMEGEVLEYQVAVNNPDAVAGYRLRSEAPGIFLSSEGLLRYTAPAKVSSPTLVTLTVEVVGKDGRTLVHQFPVFVLPMPQPDPRPEPATVLPQTP